MLRSYADFLAARSSYVQAKKLNADALQEIETLKLTHPHLAADVMGQTLCIEQAQVSSLESKKSKQTTVLFWHMEQWLWYSRHRYSSTDVYVPFVCCAVREVPAITQLGMYKENALCCIYI
jgi:hypothetical protein